MRTPWTENPLYPASALEAARREALEQAAKVADDYNAHLSLGVLATRSDAEREGLKGKVEVARHIATGIRALKENTNG